VAAFVIVAIAGVLISGGFTGEPDPETFINQAGADAFALVLGVAFVVGVLAYCLVEWLQTRRLDSITSQFDTRTIVLMPVAIALNIVLGAAVANALKIPIYLDSIGTILVAALAGPIAGAATGFIGNILWSYVIPPPFQYPPAAAFAVVAAVIGLMAGMFARAGWLRPRPDRSGQELAIAAVVSIGLIVVLAVLAVMGYRAILGDEALTPANDNVIFVILGWLAIVLVVGTVIGLLYLLFGRRDVTAAYVVVAGVATGIVAAVISAPIAANVFGGVTGSGTDFLVAALRQGGADIQAATLGQGLVSDPIDKVVTYFVVYLILGAMAVRTKARFPQGEYLIADEDALDPAGRALGATR
jgi:energy-coupling factor transport system substrate-specific component